MKSIPFPEYVHTSPVLPVTESFWTSEKDLNLEFKMVILEPGLLQMQLPETIFANIATIVDRERKFKAVVSALKGPHTLFIRNKMKEEI